MRKLICFVVLFAAGFVASARASTSDAPTALRRTTPAVCLVDTAIMTLTLNRVVEVLDSTLADSVFGDYRTENGLTGLTSAGSTVVTDSLTCKAGLRAYAISKHPGDTVKQNTFRTNLGSVFIIQLSANRYVLTGGVYNPITFIERYLYDSTWTLLERNF